MAESEWGRGAGENEGMAASFGAETRYSDLLIINIEMKLTWNSIGVALTIYFRFVRWENAALRRVQTADLAGRHLGRVNTISATIQRPFH